VYVDQRGAEGQRNDHNLRILRGFPDLGTDEE